MGQPAISPWMRILQVHVATVLTSEGTAGNRLPGPELGWLVDTQGRQRSAYKSHCVMKNGPGTHGLPPLWCVCGDEGTPFRGTLCHECWWGHPQAGQLGANLTLRNEVVPEEGPPQDQGRGPPRPARGTGPHRSVPRDR